MVSGVMSFYREHVLPWLIDLSMRQSQLTPYRSRVVSAASGRVLEIGIGSGLNLPFYGNSVSQIIGIEPSAKLLRMARAASREISMPLDLIEGTAETIPIDDRSIDTVVTTWTMCSIPLLEDALRQMRRVLRPGGRLLFVEHGRAPEPRVRWLQDHLTPVWKRFSGGCHLNRAIEHMVGHAGFRIEHLDKGYMRGPKAMTFMYEGCARPE
jgi:ubiquinone/menaquinone biosynthesis C-methylase UbiE